LTEAGTFQDRLRARLIAVLALHCWNQSEPNYRVKTATK
jgi:hypothetical protein